MEDKAEYVVIDDRLMEIVARILAEMERGREKHGPYHSWHEIYAVLQEEVDEFWDSIKQDRPDPEELIQVAAVAMRAIYEMTGGRHEQTPVS